MSDPNQLWTCLECRQQNDPEQSQCGFCHTWRPITLNKTVTISKDPDPILTDLSHIAFLIREQEERPMPRGKVGPVGGCWFCYVRDDRPMLFSGEFDTYLHRECLLEFLQKNPHDEEACHIYRELHIDDELSKPAL